jgi:DNA-binding CsgD family transcriptional regulator
MVCYSVTNEVTIVVVKTPIPKKNLVRKPARSHKKERKLGKKLRSSQMELAERRQVVVRLRLQGMTLREIGKELGCGYMTIKRDMDIIKEEVGQKIAQFDKDYALGKSMTVYEQIESEAWAQFYGCANGTTSKAQFLNLVRAARNDQVKLLTDVGLISKAPTQVTHQFEANQVLKGWTDDAKRIVALSIIRAQMDNHVPMKALDGHSPTIIDIPDELVGTVQAMGAVPVTPESSAAEPAQTQQEPPQGGNGHGSYTGDLPEPDEPDEA